MAKFTQQQSEALRDTHPYILIDTISKAGKTAVLRTKLLQIQNKPDQGDKFVYVTANHLATAQLIAALQKITALPWDQKLIGTPAEIGFKLVQMYPTKFGYTKPPRVVAEPSVIAEINQAKEAALRVYPQVTHPAYQEQADRELLELLRKKNLVTCKTLMLELVNATNHTDPELVRIFDGVKALFVDDGQDLTTAEWLVVNQLHARVPYVMVAGNSNLMVYSRHHGMDPENWSIITSREEYFQYTFNQTFNLSNQLGSFLQQLSAQNNRRVVFPDGKCIHNGGAQKVYQLNVKSYHHMQDLLLQLENHLQLHIRNRLMLIISRHPEEAFNLGGQLRRPVFIQRDKHNLLFQQEVPTRGIVCTTPFEAFYLRPDYVVMPNCTNAYWPNTREKHMDNARRAFIRSLSSCRGHCFLMVPEEAGLWRPSPFFTEGNFPKETVEQYAFS